MRNSATKPHIKLNLSLPAIVNDTGCCSLNDQLLSPRSPVTPSPEIERHEQKYSIQNVLEKHGYIATQRVVETLQGSIWKVSNKSHSHNYIVKVTKRSLHDKHVTNYRGQQIRIKENIITETACLRYLSANNPPAALARFKDFFCDKYNFFLVQEDGGKDFFEFVQKCHGYIASGSLAMSEWHRFCKIAMKQIVELLDWMHNVMHCCHLDLSLENFVISDVMVMINNRKKIMFSDNFQIKLIDFGLAEVFESRTKSGKIDFRCKKFCGKLNYKSPEVYAKKKAFDARKADTWCLAVCFFMMIVGGGPYTKPTRSDLCFEHIMNGQLLELIVGWNKLDNFNEKILDLICRLFRKEKYRLTIDEIKKHPWLL